MESTKTLHAAQARRWALIAVTLACVGAIVGAVVGYYSTKHEPIYETMKVVASWSHDPADVPLNEVEKDLLEEGYRVADPTERIQVASPDGQRGTVSAEELTEALRHGYRLTMRWVPLNVQLRTDREKDMGQAIQTASVFAGALGLLGLVPAAWYMILVMLAQVAAAVRRD